jgi:hypothetical protein
MQRREAIRGVVTLLGTIAVAGCADVEEVSDGTTDRAADEAEKTVNETLEKELVRPPDADIRVQEDGTIIVLSIAPDTVGVKCGLIQGNDPVAEVKQSENATTTAGTEIKQCKKDFVIAVNEAGDVEILAEP